MPEDATFVGVQFAVGTSLRAVAAPSLVDSGIVLPDVTRRGFWLDDRRWETPRADDAEALVARLVRDGVVVRDPVVAEAVRGHPAGVCERTLQRRFRAATGLSRGAVRQIERVRTSAQQLMAGASAAEWSTGSGTTTSRISRARCGATSAVRRQQLRDGTGGALALDPAQRTTS